jgi:hypothetical protein
VNNASRSWSVSVSVRTSGIREAVVPRAFGDLRRAFSRWGRATAVAGALSLVAPLASFGQGNVARPRVTDRVDTSRMTVLTGNTHPLARAQNDQGAAPPDLPMNRILLMLKRSPEQEASLQDLLVQQQVASSPSYHKWLTPEQFGQQFGPADADVQAVTSWLASFGFQSIKVSKGRTVVEFSGNASQIEAALHASIHKYMVNGEAHWANANDPQVPAALAPVISGFASLHNFQKKPASVRSGQTATMTRTADGKPQINFCSVNQSPCPSASIVHALAPADFSKIYNITSSTMTGSGATIGVVARSNINPQDVADFRSLFNLGGSGPNIIVNGPDPHDLGTGEEAEAVLDATWPGAVAPAATIDLVVSESTNSTPGEDLSEIYIIDNNLADIMTESFSVCETVFASSLSAFANFYSSLAQQAAAQGITFTVASGDSGPDSCDDPNFVPTSLTPKSVNLLAATPYNVAVGGTQFNDTASPSTYWNGTNDPLTLGSAKSYIPENVWNESCTVTQCSDPSLAGLWSSGGGQSIAFTKPPWQIGVFGIPATNSRFLPDVAVAAADHDGYVLCLGGSCQGSNPSFSILSGTSVSAQVFGGIMALVVQNTGVRVGIANYALYNLAAIEHPTSPVNTTCDASNITTPPGGTCVFNDVTSGNTNLTLVTPSETGFSAGTGYDEATGLGSVNVTNLVNQWHTAVNKATTTTLTLNNGTPVNVTHGSAVQFLATVAPVVLPGPQVPTGTISLVAGSTTGQGVDFFPLSGGTVNSVSVNSSTVFLPGGTYSVKAHYGGDGTYLGSDSLPTTVTITPEASRTTMGIVTTTPCTTSASVVYGSPYVLSVAVSDVHTAATPCAPNETGAFPTGNVTVTDTFNSATSPLDGGSFKLNSVGYFEDQIIQLPVGTHTITAAYAGDTSFTTSNATVTITVTKANTTTAVSANPMTVAAGQTTALTATIGTQSNAVANASQEPTRTVQFFLAGAAFGSPVPVSGSATAGGFAQAIATIPNASLPNGSNLVTAKYSGDGNYAASTSPQITVTVGSSGLNVTTGCGATIMIARRGLSGSCLITVVGANAFSGAVNLTCGVSSSPANAVDLPSCSFGAPAVNFTAPQTITLSPSSETGTATLTVNTTAASRLLQPASRHRGPNWPFVAGIAAVFAAMLLVTLAPRKRYASVILTMAVFIALAAVTACGGGGGSGVSNPGTTIGSYTITVTATPAGGAAQPSPITIVISN